MEKLILFGLLDKINPNMEDLREYMELRSSQKFPLPLYWRDHLGDYLISDEWHENGQILGIVLPDKIILRWTIEPSKRQKEKVSTKDLLELAQQVHPQARPLHFGGSSSDGIIDLLLLHGPKYLETSILLEQRGVKMPSLLEKIPYVAGGEAILAQENYALRVFQVGKKEQKSVPIKEVEKMILFIPRE